ncbi:hypothetical protein Ndes2526B_g00028 [Nannochloris sp. 'desiccata']|nr:hypothetical protein KSW81_002855 [Chlorella desiccata (nom. nud.)]
MTYTRDPSLGALFILLVISFSSSTSIAAQALSNPAAQSCKNNAARILYLRQPQWTDWSQLLTAVETTHPITSLHILDKNTCKKSKLCSTGSLAVLGDASGLLSVISPSTGVLFEISSASNTKSTGSEVTALTSFASERNSIVIVAGYRDGTLLWHTLYEEEPGLAGGRKEGLSSLSGSILIETSSAWTVLDALALHGGKHGVANIAGATADGQVAWGRIYVGTKKQKPKINGDTNELHWDSLLTASSDIATSIYTSSPSTSKDGIIAAKAHLKAAEFINCRGEIIWSPFFVKKRNRDQPHVLQPPRPCDNWNKYNPAQGSKNNSDTVGDVIGFSAVAMEAVSSPMSRIFSVVGGNSEFVSMRTGTALGKPTCHVIARRNFQSISKNNDNVNSNRESHGPASIESMATLPGYVVAVTTTGELQVYNTSGAFHRPSFSTVLQQPLHDLEAEVAEKVSDSIKKSGSTFWPRSMTWWKYGNPLIFKTGLTKNKYRIAAGVSTQFSSSSSSTTSGLVAIQFSPAIVALYATSLPYTPQRGTAGAAGSTTRINWLAALQPLLIAAVVGFVMHKAKVGKKQAAAQQFFRSKMMERAAAGSDLGRGVGGASSSSHLDDDDWDAPFPWEQRLNARNGRDASSSTAFTAVAGELNSREYRRRFKIDTGLGGRRATNNAAGILSGGGDRTIFNTIRTGSGTTPMNEEGFRLPTGPPFPYSSHTTVPPPLIDRAPHPGNTSSGARGVAAVLGDIGSDFSDSQYSDGGNVD